MTAARMLRVYTGIWAPLLMACTFPAAHKATDFSGLTLSYRPMVPEDTYYLWGSVWG